MYRMLFEERKKWKSVDASMAVEAGRNYQKHRGRCALCLGEEDVIYVLLA